MKNYDVVVIGAGPGGYVAAIRAAQLGFNTACVERWVTDEGKPALGGTCLNVGCIPSKALLDSSHHLSFIRNEAKKHGINISGVTLDINKMLQRKATVVSTLTQGVARLFKKNKVDWLQGSARLQGNNKIEVKPIGPEAGDTFEVNAKHIIIATGSIPQSIPSARVDNEMIVDSTGALNFTDVPRRLGIIGAGVIGLELGSVWSRLGAEVIILEALDDFLPTVDRKIATDAENILRKQGLDIRLGARVTGTGSNNREVTITYEDNEGKQQITVDKLIVAVGRKPNTLSLGAQEAGLDMDENGFIIVDDFCNTNIENVYAIGDVVRGPMLAHKASEEGVSVVERIAGSETHMDHDVIPWVIYTWPEIAWVGKTEQALKEQGIEYTTGSFPFIASGRAHALGNTEGLIKIISDAKTDRVLGVHILGPNASELIAEAVLSMAFEGSSEDIARTIHAHPTLAEAFHEAALAADKRAIHF
jgi:dihydrolipoamide dehydrogenase